VFAELLSIPNPAARLPETISPQHLKLMTFTAIIGQIERLAVETTILAILEDMHWADATTLDLLDRLIQRVPALPMLLVVTARPEVRPPWAARPHVTVQMLSGLDRPMAAALISQVAGGQELPQEIIDRIVAHTDGIPLFIEELAKTVLDNGST